MPLVARVDFDAVDASRAIPFATGVDGEHIEYDWKDSPHLLIVGATGGGKSVALQSFIYGLLVRGADLYVADPSKGGADFKFAVPWMTAFADTVEDTSAMLDAAYAEVVRRKNLNSKYGAGNYRELPDEVRPPHAVVVLDEFTSLIAKDKLRKPDSDDPEVLRDFEANVAKNAAIDNIGSKVGRIAREARSAGFTLLLATQRLTAKILEDLPGGADLRTNMARMILGKATFGELQSALKNPMAAPDLGEVVPPGRGMFEPMAGATQIIQSWFIPNMQDELSAALAERRPALEPGELVDLEKFRPKKRDLEVEGEIISGPATRRSRRAASTEPVVIDAGSLDLSLDDLEAFADEDEDSGHGAAPLWVPSTDSSPSAQSADSTADHSPQDEDLDWGASFGSEIDRADLADPIPQPSGDVPEVEELDALFDQQNTRAEEAPEAHPAPAPEPPRTALTAADAILGSPSAPVSADEPLLPSLEPDAGRVLILGVEGVLTPAGPHGTSEWGTADVVDAGMFGQVEVWPEMIAGLRGPWRKVWLTDWEEAAAYFLGDRLDAQVAHPVGKDGMAWKMATLEHLLSQDDVKRVVWVDGEPGESMLGMSPAELAREMAIDARVDLTIIQPAGPVLSRAEVEEIRQALRSPDAVAVAAGDRQDPFSAPVPSYRLPDPFAD